MSELRASSPLRVLILSDGIAGHYNLSKGVSLALSQKHDITTHWLNLSKPRSWIAPLVEHSINQNFLVSPFLRFLYHLDVLAEIKKLAPDIIISSGGATRYALAGAHKTLQLPTIFTGSPRRLKGESLGILLSSIKLNDPGDGSITNFNIVACPLPTRIDPKKFPDLRKTISQQLSLHDHPRLAVIIGGNGAGFTWDLDDANQLAEALLEEIANEAKNGKQLRLLIADSRRTPEGFRDVLIKRLGSAIELTSWQENSLEDPLVSFLALSDRIICTGDSATMMMECAHAAKPMIVVAPKKANPDHDFCQVTKNILNLAHVKYFNLFPKQNWTWPNPPTEDWDGYFWLNEVWKRIDSWQENHPNSLRA